MKIRLMNEDDYHYLKQLYQDESVMEMVTGYPLNEKQVQDKWEQIMSWDHQKGYGFYLCFHEENCVGIGCIKPYEDIVEIGYVLFPRYWKQGFGSMICSLMVEKALKMNADEMIAFIDIRNIASQKILLKNGFSIVSVDGNDAVLKRR